MKVFPRVDRLTFDDGFEIDIKSPNYLEVTEVLNGEEVKALFTQESHRWRKWMRVHKGWRTNISHGQIHRLIKFLNGIFPRAEELDNTAFGDWAYFDNMSVFKPAKGGESALSERFDFSEVTFADWANYSVARISRSTLFREESPDKVALIQSSLELDDVCFELVVVPEQQADSTTSSTQQPLHKHFLKIEDARTRDTQDQHIPENSAWQVLQMAVSKMLDGEQVLS